MAAAAPQDPKIQAMQQLQPVFLRALKTPEKNTHVMFSFVPKDMLVDRYHTLLTVISETGEVKQALTFEKQQQTWVTKLSTHSLGRVRVNMTQKQHLGAAYSPGKLVDWHFEDEYKNRLYQQQDKIIGWSIPLSNANAGELLAYLRSATQQYVSALPEIVVDEHIGAANPAFTLNFPVNTDGSKQMYGGQSKDIHFVTKVLKTIGVELGKHLDVEQWFEQVVPPEWMRYSLKQGEAAHSPSRFVYKTLSLMQCAEKTFQQPFHQLSEQQQIQLTGLSAALAYEDLSIEAEYFRDFANMGVFVGQKIFNRRCQHMLKGLNNISRQLTLRAEESGMPAITSLRAEMQRIKSAYAEQQQSSASCLLSAQSQVFGQDAAQWQPSSASAQTQALVVHEQGMEQFAKTIKVARSWALNMGQLNTAYQNVLTHVPGLYEDKNDIKLSGLLAALDRFDNFLTHMIPSALDAARTHFMREMSRLDQAQKDKAAFIEQSVDGVLKTARVSVTLAVNLLLNPAYSLLMDNTLNNLQPTVRKAIIARCARILHGSDYKAATRDLENNQAFFNQLKSQFEQMRFHCFDYLLESIQLSLNKDESLADWLPKIKDTPTAVKARLEAYMLVLRRVIHERAKDAVQNDDQGELEKLQEMLSLPKFLTCALKEGDAQETLSDFFAAYYLAAFNVVSGYDLEHMKQYKSYFMPSAALLDWQAKLGMFYPNFATRAFAIQHPDKAIKKINQDIPVLHTPKNVKEYAEVRDSNELDGLQMAHLRDISLRLLMPKEDEKSREKDVEAFFGNENYPRRRFSVSQSGTK